MNRTEGLPSIVRWTLRLEDATALDTAVRAVEPTIHSVFGTGGYLGSHLALARQVGSRHPAYGQSSPEA